MVKKLNYLLPTHQSPDGHGGTVWSSLSASGGRSTESRIGRGHLTLRRASQKRFVLAAVIFVLLAAAAFFVALALLKSAPKDLRVTVLDVGQGDAIFVEFPSGSRWLIDGGPDEGVVSQIDRLIAISDRRLTGVILTHPHADHVTGLIHILRRYKVEKALLPSATHTTSEYLTFLKELRAQNIQTTPVNHPFVWSGSEGQTSWRWEFFYPERDFTEPVQDLNAVSVVSRLTFGEQSFLFMGDAPVEVEKLLMAEGRNLRAAVLKVGHHGSASSTSDDFLGAVRPPYAVISAGASNPFGHPAPATLKRLQAFGARTYRTDKHGWIQFKTDGVGLTVAVEKTAD